jgi:ABC-2 type transport system permease protein
MPRRNDRRHLFLIGLIGGVPITATLVVTLFFELILVSFALTAFGVALATRMRSIQAFMAIMQMVLFPMFFASGALYPLQGLPSWLEIITRFDPLTYAVAPLRHAVLDSAGHGAAAPAVTWGSFTVPIWLDLTIVLVCGVVALAAALPKFSRIDT